MNYDDIQEDEQIKKELEIIKKKKIDNEIKKISSMFSGIDIKVKKTVTSLIENAAFMSVTLQDLQDKINRDGVTDKYQNGESQWGTKKSPEVEIYNTMVKNNASIIKQLTDLLPKKDPVPEDDGFEGFVNSK